MPGRPGPSAEESAAAGSAGSPQEPLGVLINLIAGPTQPNPNKHIFGVY